MYNLATVEHISDKHPLRENNEDLTVSLDNLVVLMDGSTGLYSSATEVRMNANEFVNLVGNELSNKWLPSFKFDVALKEVLNTINRSHESRYESSPQYLKPSASLVSFHLQNNIGIFYNIGDCRCMLFRENRILDIFTQSPLVSLDQSIIDDISKKIDEGLTAEQAQEESLVKLRHNRSLMNTHSGYGSLTSDSKCLNFLETAQVDIQNNDLVLLASDGFMAMTEVYELVTRESIFSHAIDQNFAKLIKRMRSLEWQDENMEIFPRLKQFDDASAVVIRISEFDN